MEREKTEIDLPISKIKVCIKSYFNVGEKRELQRVLFSKKGLQDLEDTNIPIEKLHDYQDKMIELGVVSFDGKSGEFVKLANELKEEKDYKLLTDSLTKLINTEKKN